MRIFSPQLNRYVKPIAQHADLARRYAAAMDVSQTRNANLKELVDFLTQGGRTQKSAAIALNLSPSFLNQLLGGKRMGDDVARKIEQTQGLAHGMMDSPIYHKRGTGVADRHSNYISHHPRIDPETIAAAIKLVRLSLLNLSIEINQEENGLPLAAAYDFLLQRQERQVTGENVVAFKPILEKLLREQVREQAS
jgi:hypothetical protein